jgi:hypothetical protein
MKKKKMSHQKAYLINLTKAMLYNKKNCILSQAALVSKMKKKKRKKN